MISIYGKKKGAFYVSLVALLLLLGILLGIFASRDEHRIGYENGSPRSEVISPYPDEGKVIELEGGLKVEENVFSDLLRDLSADGNMAVRSPGKQVTVEKKASPGQEVKEEEIAERREKEVGAGLAAMDFREADIKDVLFYLSGLSGLTIIIDQRALDELKNPRVNLYVPTAMPPLEVLKLILKIKELDYVVKENYIRVMKKEQEEGEAVTKTYRLQHGMRQLRAVELAPLEEEQK